MLLAHDGSVLAYGRTSTPLGSVGAAGGLAGEGATTTIASAGKAGFSSGTTIVSCTSSSADARACCKGDRCGFQKTTPVLVSDERTSPAAGCGCRRFQQHKLELRRSCTGALILPALQQIVFELNMNSNVSLEDTTRGESTFAPFTDYDSSKTQKPMCIKCE